MGRRRENRVQLRKWRIILNMVEMVGEEKVVERALEEVVVEKAMEKKVVEKLVEKSMEENVAMMEEKIEGEKEKAGGEMVETASPPPKPGCGLLEALGTNRGGGVQGRDLATMVTPNWSVQEDKEKPCCCQTQQAPPAKVTGEERPLPPQNGVADLHYHLSQTF